MMVVHNLPHAVAPFINRVSEIAEITQSLNDPECRLLTLFGPGGIGKTRLAMRVATDCVDQFDDGVYFVPLHAVESPEIILSTIADILSFPFVSVANPQNQLFQYLREKTLLLVLDNFEHLLDGAGLLTEILHAAPALKLMVTSREILNLQEEWLYMVRGLHYPETDDAEQPGVYSAVQLFIERARQVRSDIALADEQAAVIRVCQLVEGMPLALELASVWTKTLSIHEIAIEIQRSLDFLSTSLRNVPQRHQSMQAVFEQTWQRLSDEEQRVFKALSVFIGGFRREAAEAVAGVSTRILSNLVDKSLLMREPNGRYQIHELLRQYAQARLQTIPEEAALIHDLHAAYYARFMDERNDDLNGGRQREVSVEVEADIDNVRAAWSWAVEHSRVDYIDQAEHALMRFHTIKSHFREGSVLFERAVQVLDTGGDMRTEIRLAKALADLGVMYVRGGSLEKAKAVVERSWLLYSKHNALPVPGRGNDPRLTLGLTYFYLGRNIHAAEQLVREALDEHIIRHDDYNLALAYHLLARFARLHGKYEEARNYIQRAYTHVVKTGDAFIGAYSLGEWGALSNLLGDTADAKRRLHDSYNIHKDLEDRQGMAHTLIGLGRIALLEGESADARRCFEQARSICHDLGVHGDVATSLEGMANSARAQGHYGEARRYLREALLLSSQQMASRTPSILISISELFLHSEQQTRGIELLALALYHPAGDHDSKERARRLLTYYQATAETVQLASGNTDFEVVISALLDELQISEYRELTQYIPQSDKHLLEPLSERELEVLILIADDLSNREIADRLFLSVATVKWYLTHIYSKLGVQNRTLAVVRARQLNLLP